MFRRSIVVAVVVGLSVGVVPAFPARAENPVMLIPPVDAAVSRSFVAPEGPYGAGHRGVDYAVPSGTRVRAAASGRIAFAGSVAGDLAITIDHGSGVATTYSQLSSLLVAEGQAVSEGAWIGLSGRSHAEDGLHLGAKIDGGYVDPMSLMGPVDVSGAIHLAPLVWSPERLGGLERLLVPTASAGTAARVCEDRTALQRASVAPNDNVAVAVAGIASKTEDGIDAEIYEHGPQLLGYDEARSYRFSYRGSNGPGLHEPYRRTDTYSDLRLAAARLRSLMMAVHRRHPEAEVDLIAHSQGGVVARLYLARAAAAWDARLPKVDHFVTFSSPHRGVRAAAEVAELERTTFTGSGALDAASSLSNAGLPLPDPRSAAVRQLAPDSGVMEGLAAEDVSFGTRVLTLAIPNDPVVPADRASIPEEMGRVVPWQGGPASGHSAIVRSSYARALAHAFLRDDSPSCATGWDAVGPVAGAAWSALQSGLAEGYGALEERAAVAALGVARVPPPAGRLIYRSALRVRAALRR